MKYNPLSIIDEFLRSPDVQVRKNALTALAAIDTDESIAKLVDMVLKDDNEEVRRRGEDELLQLGSESQSRVTKAFNMALADKEQQKPAYALLGRLRSRGYYVPVTSLTMLTKLRLTMAMTPLVYPVRDWQFRTRSIFPGVLGGLFGSLLVFFFLAIFNPISGKGIKIDNETVGVLIFSPLLFSPFFVVFLTQRVVPINLQFDRFAARITEFGGAVVFGLLLSVVLFVLVILLNTLPSYNSGYQLLLHIMLLPLFLAAIRGGSLLISGFFTKDRLNRYAEVAVGSVCGAVMLTAIAMLSLLLMKAEPIHGDWLWYNAICVGLAVVYARIDAESTPLMPIAGWAGALLSLMIVGVFVVSVILILFPIPQKFLMYENNLPQANCDKALRLDWQIKELPKFKYFYVDFTQKVSLEFAPQPQPEEPEEESSKDEKSSWGYKLYLYNGQRLIADGDHEQGITKELEQGYYRIEVYLKSKLTETLTSKNIIPELILHVAGKLGLNVPSGPGMGTEIPETIKLKLVLNSDT